MDTTQIKGGRHDKITVSEDEGDVIILFVPDEADPEHFHIRLTEEEAARLKNWLNDYFVDKILRKRRDKLNAEI
jgi:hypothetical protein